MWFLLPLLVACAAAEIALAIHCYRRLRFAKLSSVLLIASAPWQIVVAIWGETWLRGVRTPSSFDPLGDGIDIGFRWALLTLFAAFIPGLLCLWLAYLAACDSLNSAQVAEKRWEQE